MSVHFLHALCAASLELKGDEQFDLLGLNDEAQPRQQVTLAVTRPNGAQESIELTLRLDTPAELDYVRSGGILPYVLRQLTIDNQVR